MKPSELFSDITNFAADISIATLCSALKTLDEHVWNQLVKWSISWVGEHRVILYSANYTVQDKICPATEKIKP